MPGVVTSVDCTGSDHLTIRQVRWGRVRRRRVRMMLGIGTGVRYGVHDACLENVARGIVERVFCVRNEGGLGRPPRPVTGAFDRLRVFGDRLVEHLNSTTVVSRDSYPELYHGRKRVVYQRAVDSLHRRGVAVTDAIVSTFVKAEKVNFTAKPDPAPRVIQPRTPRYNVEVGRYLKLFECEIVRGFKRLCGYNVILKGLNAAGVATQLRDNWKAFRDPVVVGLDASRFDQHVSVEALKFEHSVYNRVFRSPELKRLLSWQLSNRGIARVGNHRVDYSVEGCRMSGDINTGMGNCLIMSCMVLAFLEEVGVNARLGNNGDDCVLFLNRGDLTKLKGLPAWFLELGFNMVVEAPVYVFERIVFCQAQPVLTSSGWRMTRDPAVAPSKDAVSLLSWSGEMPVRQWCGAIGACGLQLTRGVPFWQQYYSNLVAYGVESDAACEAVRDSGLGYMARGLEANDFISPESRVSFYKAFGMTPDMQVSLEQEFTLHDLAAPKLIINPSQIEIIDSDLARWARANKQR